MTGRRQDTADTWTLELEGTTPLEFQPGQFTMLGAAGCGEVPISISGDPDGPARLVHTVRAVGPATAAICAAEPGRVLGVRGPFGRPWPVDDVEGADVVVVAGGIGLAPLRPAILRLLARRERYGRIVVLYGGRTPDTILYPSELLGWDAAVTVDAAGRDWRGRVGVVPKLIDGAAFDPGSAVAMTCGPEVMMRFAVEALLRRGVAPDRAYVSMERNMQCGIGHCGHCQLGPTLVCRDGPVYTWEELEPWLAIREL
ncbi:MAG: FAD/NAD(P)-binding protein [Solirubrobacteraceae bacterium]